MLVASRPALLMFVFDALGRRTGKGQRRDRIDGDQADNTGNAKRRSLRVPAMQLQASDLERLR